MYQFKRKCLVREVLNKMLQPILKALISYYNLKHYNEVNRRDKDFRALDLNDILPVTSYVILGMSVDFSTQFYQFYAYLI